MIWSFNIPALWSIMPCDVPDENTQSVSTKIADAALNIHAFGARAPASAQVVLSLRQYLSNLIVQGVTDNQVLLDEGVAFLRGQETKKVR